MILLTKKNLADLPPLGSQDGKGDDAIAHVKLFNPCGAATWYLSEYDPATGEAFGLADLGMGHPELGYVSVPELAAIKLRYGLKIERDRHWAPRALKECRQ